MTYRGKWLNDPQDLLFEVSDRVARITLNKPDKRPAGLHGGAVTPGEKCTIPARGWLSRLAELVVLQGIRREARIRFRAGLGEKSTVHWPAGTSVRPVAGIDAQSRTRNEVSAVDKYGDFFPRRFRCESPDSIGMPWRIAIEAGKEHCLWVDCRVGTLSCCSCSLQLQLQLSLCWWLRGAETEKIVR